MAGIITDKIGFEGIKNKNGKIYYTTDKLKVFFNVDRTGTTSYTTPKIRVAIYSGSEIIGDTGFLSSSSADRGYEGGVSTYPMGWANCTITDYKPITKVLVELQVQLGTSKLSDKINISEANIYDSLSKGNGVGSLLGEKIDEISPSDEYQEIINSNVPAFSIKGISNDSKYLNGKYHNGSIQLLIPKIKYYSYEGFPDRCIFSAINTETNEEILIEDITNPSKQKFSYKEKKYNQFRLTVEHKNAIKIYDVNIQYFENFLNLKNKVNINSNFIQPNKIVGFDDKAQTYKQIILLQGKISFNDNEFPYQINSASNFSLKVEGQDYNEEKELKPSITSSGWVFDQEIDFGSNENNNLSDKTIYLSFSIKNSFATDTQSEEKVDFTVEEEYFKYYENLEILPDLLKISISKSSEDENDYKEGLIVNQHEKIKIEYDQTKIFVPHLRRFLNEEDNQYEIDYQLYTDRYETTDGMYSYTTPLELENSQISYEKLYKIYDQEDYGEDTYKPSQTTLFQNLFVKVKLKQGDIILENEINSDDAPLKSIQLGRTVEPQLSSCYLRENLLIFQLSEYGGDKNDSLTELDFYQNEKSSLYRGFGEKLKLKLYIKDEEPIFYDYLIPNNLFWKENSNIEISLEELEIDCSKIIQIDFYNYCFLDETKSLSFTTEKIKIEYFSPRPNIGHRKNGFIINGTPGQQLSDTEFIQINILDTNKDISFYVNDLRVGGIKYRDGKLHLDGFVID